MIIITGGSGLLGSSFKNILPNAHYPTRKELDLNNKNEINLCDYFRDDSGYSRYFNYNK